MSELFLIKGIWFINRIIIWCTQLQINWIRVTIKKYYVYWQHLHFALLQIVLFRWFLLNWWVYIIFWLFMLCRLCQLQAHACLSFPSSPWSFAAVEWSVAALSFFALNSYFLMLPFCHCIFIIFIKLETDNSSFLPLSPFLGWCIGLVNAWQKLDRHNVTFRYVIFIHKNLF